MIVAHAQYPSDEIHSISFYRLTRKYERVSSRCSSGKMIGIANAFDDTIALLEALQISYHPYRFFVTKIMLHNLYKS